MLSTAIIIFREILEISLIVSIVMASTKELPKRNLLVFVGIIAGIILSIIVALFTREITNMLEGMGQEYLNIGILLAAIMMICWIIIWMNTHAKELTKKLKFASKKVISGAAPFYTIIIIVATSVLREGFEIILFLNGLFAAGASVNDLIVGGTIGLLIGCFVGLLLYKGLVILSPKYLFKITSYLLILLAAGMAAQVANYLSAVDLITIFPDPVWDSSWLLSEASITGKTLHTLIGYSEQPTGIELLFYLVTFITLIVIANLSSNKQNKNI